MPLERGLDVFERLSRLALESSRRQLQRPGQVADLAGEVQGVADPDCLGGVGCTEPNCSADGCEFCYDADGGNVGC